MIGENRHLTDNAMLNKHRKAPSEASTRELPILPNHTLLHPHPTLPYLTNWSWCGRPLAPFLRHCTPSMHTFKRATSTQLHSSRSPSPLLAPTLAAPRAHPRRFRWTMGKCHRNAKDKETQQRSTKLLRGNQHTVDVLQRRSTLFDVLGECCESKQWDPLEEYLKRHITADDPQFTATDQYGDTGESLDVREGILGGSVMI